MKTRLPGDGLLSRISRRRFVGTAGSATALAGAGLLPEPGRAGELPRVSEDGAIAKALNYVHDAQTVDAAKRLSDQYCSNCVFFAGSVDNDWAGCDLFPGKAVAARGWCSAWGAE